MAVQQLPSGKWRATVTRNGKRVSAADVLGLTDKTFPNEKAARRAQLKAEDKIKAEANGGAASEITVAEWRERWLTEPAFQTGKQSTTVHRRYETAAFAELFGHVRMRDVDSALVGRWLASGRHAWRVPSLRAMFSAATKPVAGDARITTNPFLNLGLARKKGNAEKDPPSEAAVRALIDTAWRIAPPGFAAWLQVACWSGLRHGELDALTWDDVDFNLRRIYVRRALNTTTGLFDTTKNGRKRTALLLPEARDALLRVLSESPEYCFTNLSGEHWTKNARDRWWRKVQEQTKHADWQQCQIEDRTSLYLCTRHFAGHYLYEVLRNSAEDVAVILGHTDKGDLVRKLYGHHNAEAALDRVMATVEGTGSTLRVAA